MRAFSLQPSAQVQQTLLPGSEPLPARWSHAQRVPHAGEGAPPGGTRRVHRNPEVCRRRKSRSRGAHPSDGATNTEEFVQALEEALPDSVPVSLGQRLSQGSSRRPLPVASEAGTETNQGVGEDNNRTPTAALAGDGYEVLDAGP